MPEAAIALGSNLAGGFGSREANLMEAVARIGGLGRVTAVSAFHDTTPVGYTDQPRFLNGALLLDTILYPLELLHALLGIERSMGRDRVGAPPKGPRIIDLDLLLYADEVRETAELTLPHPRMVDRIFVLQPLAEIAPGWRHPVTNRTIVELLTYAGTCQV